MQPVFTKDRAWGRWAAVAVVSALAAVLAASCGNNSSSSGGDSQATGDAAPSTASGDQEGPCPSVSEADRAKVVAKVGDVAITVCDMTEALNKMSPYLRKAYEAPQKRQQFLDNMIRFELIAQEAERRGYANDEEVQRVRKQMMIQRLNKQLQESIRLSDITDEEMQAYYEAHASDYHKAEMVRIARVLTKTQQEAEQVLSQAQEKANDSRFFRQLARDHSIDEETREHGGDLPYFPRATERQEGDPEIDPALVEAAFSLEMREPLYAKAIKSADGWNVIRLRGRRKARDLSFDDVKRQIRHRLHRDKLRDARDTLVAKLRKNSKIVINEEELASIQIELPSEAPQRPGAASDAPPPPPGKAPAKAPVRPPIDEEDEG